MNKMLIAAAASSVLLAGCASGLDEQTVRINELNNNVAQLSEQVSMLKGGFAALEAKTNKATAAIVATQSALSATQEEAARANERIDNIAHSYTK